MKLNSSGDFPEENFCLELTEENLNNLRPHVEHRLKQFPSLGIYEADDILNAVAIRYKEALLSGKNIPNPEAWVRVTGYNIIRELSRKQSKCQSFEPNTLESVFASSEESILVLEKQEESERVHKALKELSPEIQELLKLRFFQGLLWQEIALHLAQNGQNVSVATLRKRGERAINQLREVYFEKFL